MKEEIIYKISLQARIFSFFFYYWFGFSHFIFLGISIWGTIYLYIEFLSEIFYSNGYFKLNDPVLWIGVVGCPPLAFWLLKHYITRIRSMFRPYQWIEGWVVRKEEREDEDGIVGSYVLWTTDEKEFTASLCSSSVNKGDHLRIKVSEKIGEPILITRIINS
jgi:hypothetical protein